jgi:hypothetical protein
MGESFDEFMCPHQDKKQYRNGRESEIGTERSAELDLSISMISNCIVTLAIPEGSRLKS